MGVVLMYRRPRRALPLVVGVVVVALLAVYGIDRMMVALVGVGPLSVFRVPLPVVRDGWIAGGERQAAIEAAGEFTSTLAPTGATTAAKVTFSTCSEGSNSWKRQDGYRLSCRAGLITYQGWSGDFATTRDQVRASLTATCSGPEPVLADITPHQGSIGSEAYSCGSGIEVRANFGTSNGLVVTDPAIRASQGDGFTRQITGPSADEIIEALATYQWFVVLDVHKTYYQDQP